MAQGEYYIFVLDRSGYMVAHPDPELQGKNQIELKDVNGRPIIRGLLQAATAAPGKRSGWYHYQWPVPGGLLPRWKSSYVRLVSAPSGREYVVGSGVYNDRMERGFVTDMVANAVEVIERLGTGAFPLLRDPTGPFLVKDAYVFVVDLDGIELVNPAFPNLEGRNLLDVKDTQGKYLVREMLEVVRSADSGWVDYMWPKPGDHASTLKSTWVRRALLEGRPVLVGAGVYLAHAPRETLVTARASAPDVTRLVRAGAAVLEREGERAYPSFREKDSRWFHNGTYLFVWNMNGVRTFNAAIPEGEGLDVSELKDILGRPLGRMILEVAASPSGEGWIHYMYPEPGGLFPTWKSTFLKRVTYPSGEQFVVGSGIYNMRLERAFIEDVVDRAAALIEARGRGAFDRLRDQTGPFRFMDIYVFVDTPDGTELVNPAQPSLEGTNLMGLKDVNGKPVAREYIAAAMKDGRAWVEYYWYKPGDNVPARKETFVRKVVSNGETFIVGSGLYLDR
jgi:signal transduction histidine kinase